MGVSDLTEEDWRGRRGVEVREAGEDLEDAARVGRAMAGAT
jgi:hypothetical protein